MIQVKKFEVRPLSMVTKGGLQCVDIHYHVSAAAHMDLQVFRQGAAVTEKSRWR